MMGHCSDQQQEEGVCCVVQKRLLKVHICLAGRMQILAGCLKRSSKPEGIPAVNYCKSHDKHKRLASTRATSQDRGAAAAPSWSSAVSSPHTPETLQTACHRQARFSVAGVD